MKIENIKSRLNVLTMENGLGVHLHTLRERHLSIVKKVMKMIDVI